MIKLIITLLPLVCLCRLSTAQTSDGSVIPITQLSADNPNHKHIIDWFDNYKQKMSQMSANNLNTDQSSLQKPDSHQSHPQQDYATNQPQQNQVDQQIHPKYLEQIYPENDKKGQIDRRDLGSVLIPYAFSQTGGQNAQLSQQSNSANNKPIKYNPLPNGPAPNIEDLFAKQNRPQEATRAQGQQQDPKSDLYFHQYLKSLQDRNTDGRTVVVEVKGDDLLEQIRPLLKDPTVIERLRPTLQESTSLLSKQDRRQAEQLAQPLLIQQKSAVLELDRPLSDQKHKIDQLRQTLVSELESNKRLNPEEQRAFNRFLHENRALLPSVGAIARPHSANQKPVPTQQPVLVEQRLQIFDPKTLLDQIQHQAINPLLQHNNPQQQLVQQIDPVPANLQNHVTAQPSHDLRQALSFGTQAVEQRPAQVPQQKYQQNAAQVSYKGQSAQAIFLGQESPNTSKGFVLSYQNGGIVNVDEAGNGQSLARQESGQYELTHQQQRRQQEPERPQPRPQPQRSLEMDDQRKQQLREELIVSFEEQERKRQELLELDLKQRQMIDEQIRIQEQRDQEEALRQAQIKKERATSARLQAPGHNRPEPVTRSMLDRPTMTTPRPVQHAVNMGHDNRWNNQGEPQRMTSRNDQGDNWNNQGGDQMHTVRYQQTEPILVRQTNRPTLQPTEPTVGSVSDNRWSSMESPPLEQIKQRQQERHLKVIEEGRPAVGISLDALAQAELIDPEYVRRLRDILRSTRTEHQLRAQDQQSGQVSFVPVEAPPTGAALTTTHRTVPDNGGTWWKSDKFENARDLVKRQIDIIQKEKKGA